MMPIRHLHVIHLLIRRSTDDGVALLLCLHDKWLDADRQPLWTLPTKRSVDDPDAPVLQGTPVDAFVDDVAQQDLGLREDEYCLECEIRPGTIASSNQAIGSKSTRCNATSSIG